MESHVPLDDLSRPIDWRMQAAKRLAQGAALNPALSDGLVRRAANYIKLQEQARTSGEQERLKAKFPTISTAQQIRFAPHDGGRTAIEARLLAGYPREIVAELSALDLAVVWTYAALHFDVADRLHADDFIWSQVVGFQQVDEGVQDRNRKAVLWLSWIGGPHVADALLLPGVNVGFAQRENDVGEHLLDISQTLIDRVKSLAPFLAQLDTKQASQFMHWSVQSSYLRQTEPRNPGHRHYLDNVSAFLSDVELSVGRKTIPTGPAEKYYKGAIEPRADEWEAIGRGEATPELDKLLADKSPLGVDADKEVVRKLANGGQPPSE